MDSCDWEQLVVVGLLWGLKWAAACACMHACMHALHQQSLSTPIPPTPTHPRPQPQPQPHVSNTHQGHVLARPAARLQRLTLRLRPHLPHHHLWHHRPVTCGVTRCRRGDARGDVPASTGAALAAVQGAGVWGGAAAGGWESADGGKCEVGGWVVLVLAVGVAVVVVELISG